MKLIIKDYLASLRERGELDAVLPDLLSQMGLNVYSRPGIGTRQDGVDVGAVGSLDGGPEKVYLFSIKPGNLTRDNWDIGGVQALRPSLNEILDAYIPTKLPTEHRGKDIVICVAIGGDVDEQVSVDLRNFIAKNTKDNISFAEWNGDKIADYIQANFLREDLLPEHARSRLRKSLALLDEPEASYRHFASLIRSVAAVDDKKDAQRIRAIRQMCICLWILFAWARDAKNAEAAYLSAELTLLYAWNIAKITAGKKTRAAQAVEAAYFSIFSAYHQICNEFLGTNVLPHVGKLHGLSSAIHGACGLDINLKLFDILGRLGVDGIWAYWGALRCKDGEDEQRNARLDEAKKLAAAVKSFIQNNPALLLPAKDSHAIDISFALSLLSLDSSNREFLLNWLSEMVDRARFSLAANGRYPCVAHSYSELLEHPKPAEDKEYRENATSGSVLYPMIALWAALLEDDELYGKVAALQKEHLPHCTFQLWYPDERSEERFYTNPDAHGAVTANLTLARPKEQFLNEAFDECEATPHFKELSAVKFGWWALLLVACRHYRLPMPLHLLQGLRKDVAPKAGDSGDANHGE